MYTIKTKKTMLFCLLIVAFKIFWIPTVVQKVLKFVIVLMVGTCFLGGIQKAKLFNCVNLYPLCIFAASLYGYFYGYIGMAKVIDALVYSLIIFLLFFLITEITLEDSIDCVYRVLQIYFWLSLVSVILVKLDVIHTEYYFAGNKFRTMYYSLLYICMYKVRNVKIKKIKRKTGTVIVDKHIITFWGLLFSLLLISRIVDCSTGTVIVIMVAIFEFIPDKWLSILKQPKIVVLTLVCSALFLLVLNEILDMPFIRTIIVSLLHEDLGLTGRFAVYDKIRSIILRSPLFGYGYGNSAVYMATNKTIANVQSSIFQMIVDYGVLGTGSFILINYVCLRKEGRVLSSYQEITPLYSYIYAMQVAAIIEIVFDYWYVVAIYLIYSYNRQDKTKNQTAPL